MTHDDDLPDSVDELPALWEPADLEGGWADHHTEAAKARAAELTTKANR